MDNLTKELQSKQHVLIKLLGHGSVAIEDIGKGVPSHERGEIISSMQDLIRAGLVRVRFREGQPRVSINSSMMREIRRILEGTSVPIT